MRVTQPTVRRTAKPYGQRPATTTANARPNAARTGAAAYAADGLTLSGAAQNVLGLARPKAAPAAAVSAASSGGFFSALGSFFSHAFSWLGSLFGHSSQPIPQLPPVMPTPTPIGTTPSSGNAQGVAMSIAENFAQNYHYVYAMKTWPQAISDIPTTEATHGGNCTDLAAEAIKEFEADGINAVGRMGDLNGGAHMWVNYQDPATGAWHFFDPTEAVANGAYAALDPSGTPNTYTNETQDIFQL